LFYVISFSVLIDCLLIYCVVFIVFYCVAYSLFFFYNFLMAFVRLSLNCIVTDRQTDLVYQYRASVC